VAAEQAPQAMPFKLTVRL